MLITGNPSGTFLVRITLNGKLSLSVRDGEGCKHYRIREMDEGGYFLAARQTFQTLRVRESVIITSQYDVRIMVDLKLEGAYIVEYS